MRPLSLDGDMTLGHLLDAAGLAEDDVLVVRHTFTKGGLVQGQVTPEAVLSYTRQQDATWSLGESKRLWLCFFADGQLRSRYYGAYVNHGEVIAERTPSLKHFDLRLSSELSSMCDRLVIRWSADAVRWAKSGRQASSFPIVEIADRREEAFPGFAQLRLQYWELVDVMNEPRYSSWRSALETVQGVYAISDTSNGKLYVGKADGKEGILGRWRQYAADGHGGNKALLEIAASAPEHRHNFVFSVLRVFDPAARKGEVAAAEAHFKQALQTRVPFGYNVN